MDDLDPRVGMIADSGELVARLASAIAFEQDAKLQANLRSFAKLSNADPMMVRLPDSEAWLRIDPGQELTVNRAPIDGIAQVRFSEAVDSDWSLRMNLVGAMARTKALQQARQLLTPLFDAALIPTREQIRTLLKWSPALDRVAYRYCARTTSLLDRLRRPILSNLGRYSSTQDARLVGYWHYAHAMGHITLLASTPGSRPWLVDMADSFVWVNWTPSFPLLRERTLWLAALAARSAIAFGEPVVEKYLSTLALATHPMKSFDAIFGLLAIALDQDRIADAVVAELVKQRSILARPNFPNAAYTDLMLKTAIRTLRESGAAQREFVTSLNIVEDWRQCGLVGLLSAAALRSDPANVLPSGRYLGLTALPMIVALPAEAYYPRETTAHSKASITPGEISAIFERTWRPGTPAVDSRSVH